MTNSTRGLAVLALTFSVVANAGQADICYSDPYPMIGSPFRPAAPFPLPDSRQQDPAPACRGKLAGGPAHAHFH
ncbi:MAG: hypothetical protein IPH43_13480 [Xanthomonadales bacterium]|nr:hypothetical protein [Xanthomonadales bacterium]